MAQPLCCRECGAIARVTVSKINPNRRYPSDFCSVECNKNYRRLYLSKWNSENRDRVSKNREANREQVRAWDRDFYARHRERRKKLRVEQYKANPEKALAAARKYAKEHPDLIRRLSHKSALKRRAIIAQVYVETVDPVVVFERGKGVCGICKHPVASGRGWEIDHVIPLSKGGAHSYANVQLSHRRCNRSKGAKLPESPDA